MDEWKQSKTVPTAEVCFAGGRITSVRILEREPGIVQEVTTQQAEEMLDAEFGVWAHVGEKGWDFDGIYAIGAVEYMVEQPTHRLVFSGFNKHLRLVEDRCQERADAEEDDVDNDWTFFEGQFLCCGEHPVHERVEVLSA